MGRSRKGRKRRERDSKKRKHKVYAGTRKHSTTTKRRGEIRMIYSYLLANYRTMPLPQIQSTVPGYDESETPEAEKTQAALSAIGRGKQA